MKVILQDVDLFKNTVDTLSSFITEGTFKFTKEGIELMAMDPASIAMIILKMLPSMFLEYEVNGEEVTLPINDFAKVIKRAKASERLQFEIKENRFVVTIEGNYKRKFYLPILEAEMNINKAPSLNFKVKAKMDSDVIENGIKDAKMITDNIIIEAKKDEFKITAEGTNSSTELILTKDSPSLISLEVEEESKSKYSLDYLERILKATKISKEILLQFSSKYPLQIDFTSVDKMNLSFILAPRMDVEE